VVQQRNGGAVKTKSIVAQQKGSAIKTNYLTAGAETMASR